MATTTAQLILTSTDLLSDSLSVSAIATLTGAGNSTGLTQSSGLTKKTMSATAAAAIQAGVLYRAGDYTANASNKVYIKNMSTTAAQFFTVTIDQEEIGRLYAGDWMFIPLEVAVAAQDVAVDAVGVSQVVEWCFVHEGKTLGQS